MWMPHRDLLGTSNDAFVTSLSTIVILSLICIASAHATTHNRDVIAQNNDVIAAARCRARCLGKFQNARDLNLRTTAEKRPQPLTTCARQPDCAACLQPCNHTILLEIDDCEDICAFLDEDAPCLESCRFLQRIQSTHAGACPKDSAPARSPLEGLPVTCFRACRVDSDCDPGRKCCEGTECGGRTCTLALPAQHDQLPSVPPTPTLRERPRGGSAVELTWTSVESSTNPSLLVYLVDLRSHVGLNHSEAEMSPWQHSTEAYSSTVVIPDLVPGHWYQFRVSAVSEGGASGWSHPTLPFTLSTEPRRPGPPTNVTEGDTLIMGGRMAVTLHWSHPSHSDLPVARYKLFWSKRVRSSGVHQATSVREHRQVLPGDRLVFQIPSLESATTYFVQVQAICHYGEERLKSDKTGVYITTYPVPEAADDQFGVGPVESGVSGGKGGLLPPTPPPVQNLTAQPPYYEGGVLRVNVSWTLGPDYSVQLVFGCAPEGSRGGTSQDKVVVHWSPEACIADSNLDDDLSRVMSSPALESFHILHDLRPDCRYLVRVEVVSGRGVIGDPTQISVSTPSCGHARVLDEQQPDCLNNVPRVPDEPLDLSHSFIISSSNVTSRVSWASPAHTLVPITGYRVVWGQLLRLHEANPTMDKSTATTKVLPKGVRTLDIGSLQEGTTYLVRVQAMSRLGPGRIASLQFTTPLLQAKPADSSTYKDVSMGGSESRRPDASKRKQQDLPVVTSLLHARVTSQPHAGGLHAYRDRTTLLHPYFRTVASSSTRLRQRNSSLLQCLLLQLFCAIFTTARVLWSNL